MSTPAGSVAVRGFRRFGVLAAVAAAAGAGGYVLGYRAGMDEREHVRRSEPTAVIQLPAERAAEQRGGPLPPAPSHPAEPSPDARTTP